MTESIYPLFYFAPISWYAQILTEEKILLEKYDNYHKQTYRNRCNIYSPNGKLVLSIPTKHIGEKRIYNTVIVDDSERWRIKHLRSLEAAYRSSPYFEFYEDAIKSVYNFSGNTLVEFNYNAHLVILKILKLNVEQSFTEQYIDNYENDYRECFASIKSNRNYTRYIQVFGNRYGFLPDLSILDLIFCLGPETGKYLKKSVISEK